MNLITRATDAMANDPAIDAMVYDLRLIGVRHVPGKPFAAVFRGDDDKAKFAGSYDSVDAANVALDVRSKLKGDMV